LTTIDAIFTTIDAILTTIAVKMIQYIPLKTMLELVQVFSRFSVVLRRRFTQNHFVQKQVQADPRRKRNVENILQTFVDDVSSSFSRYLPSPLPLIVCLQHALFSHHDRGTSSSPFDPRNIYNSHSHEVDSISRGKPMTAQGDLPQRPNHPHAGTRRSGEFERGVSQSHRSNLSDHNFAQTYPANSAINPASASESHHIRRPSFDNGRGKDDQVLHRHFHPAVIITPLLLLPRCYLSHSNHSLICSQLFPFDHEQASDHDASSEGCPPAATNST
jgi:hypothetical protein